MRFFSDESWHVIKHYKRIANTTGTCVVASLLAQAMRYMQGILDFHGLVSDRVRVGPPDITGSLFVDRDLPLFSLITPYQPCPIQPLTERAYLLDRLIHIVALRCQYPLQMRKRQRQNHVGKPLLCLRVWVALYSGPCVYSSKHQGIVLSFCFPEGIQRAGEVTLAVDAFALEFG
ncbi:hypothetical protein AUP68_07098 [Ilyonectria robusta]